MVERLVANEKVVGSSPIARSILSIMSDLAEKKCIPCEGGIPSFKIDEIHKYLKKVDGWDVKPDESKNYYLIKEFKYKNFLESQKFFFDSWHLKLLLSCKIYFDRVFFFHNNCLLYTSPSPRDRG